MNPSTTPSSPRRHRWLLSALAVILLAGAGVWFSTRARAASTPPPGQKPAGSAVPVTMATAELKDVDVVLNALGTVTPVSTVTITSRVAGVLQEVHYTEGQMVKQNDLLAVIDPRPYQAALLQAQGQLARDQAQLTNAHLDLERYRNAVREHAIPEQQVATQEAVVSADEGAVKFDQGTVDAAQVNLDYTRIVSPIEGRVGLRMIDAGNNVAANGTSGLVILTQLQPITVVFPLAQDYLAQVLTQMKNGQALRVEAYDRTQPGPVAQGELATIDNQVDPATGTFRLKGTFKNENTTLWPGEFVNLRFIVSVRKNALTVPTRAVQQGPKGNYLFVVKPDSTVEMRTIEVAQTDPDVAVITKGLNAGEKIVVDGQYRLEQGTKVALQAPPNGDKS